MKAVVINTSPDRERGRISALVNPFIEGLRDSGAAVDLYYSRDLLIFPCCGNLNCTVRTPGKCMAWDDMRWLRKKIGEADVLVLASPLYYNGFTGRGGITGSLKQLLERLSCETDVPEDTPYEHAVHTTQEAVSLRKVVVVSGSGFWEIDDFNPVLTHLKAFCYNTYPELAGCITGPRGAKVRGVLPEGASESDIRAIAEAAGREMIETARPASKVLPAARADREEKHAAAGREWHNLVLFEFPTM